MGKINQRQLGMTIIEVLIAVGMLGILSVAVASLFTDMNKNLKLVETKLTLAYLKDDLAKYVSDPNIWADTYNNPANDTSLSCLRDETTPCTPGYKEISSIISQTSTLLTFGTSSGSQFHGFTKSGAPCSTYTTSGNPACPIRIILDWRPDCLGACANPIIKIRARFFYQGGSGDFAINASRYDFELTRPGRPPTTEQTCIGMGGTFDITDNSCEMTQAIQSTSCTTMGGTWTPPSGPCTLTVTSTQCSSIGGTYNTTTRTCTLPIVSTTESTQASCTSLGGTYNTSTGRCSLPATTYSTATCPTGQIMIGLTASGTPNCRRLSSTEIPTLTVDKIPTLPPEKVTRPAGSAQFGGYFIRCGAYQVSYSCCYASNPATGACSCNTANGFSEVFTGFSYAGGTPYYYYYLCQKP